MGSDTAEWSLRAQRSSLNAATQPNGHCERSEAVSTRRHSPMVTALVFTNYYTFPTTGYFKPTTYAEWLGFKNNLYYLVAD